MATRTPPLSPAIVIVQSSIGSETVGLEQRLPPLLSIIAGLVDTTGFLTLAHVFTAHITGNLVELSGLFVRGSTIAFSAALAVPTFIVAVAGTYVIARISGRRDAALARLLLAVQLALLAAVCVVAIATKPSRNPEGAAGIATAMIAVCAMGCQYALLRLALPRAVSTAVMTGNLTNAVLSAMGLLCGGEPFEEDSRKRLMSSLPLLAGFVAGCIVAAVGVSLAGDTTWLLPLALSGLALAVR